MIDFTERLIDGFCPSQYSVVCKCLFLFSRYYSWTRLIFSKRRFSTPGVICGITFPSSEVRDGSVITHESCSLSLQTLERTCIIFFSCLQSLICLLMSFIKAQSLQAFLLLLLNIFILSLCCSLWFSCWFHWFAFFFCSFICSHSFRHQFILNICLVH